MLICSVCILLMVQAVYVGVHLKMNHFILECCLYNEASEELKFKLVFLNKLKIEVLLFGDNTITEMQIYKFSNLYNCTSNEQNVLPIYDHNSPSHVCKSIISRCFHFTYKYGKQMLILYNFMLFVL